MTNDEYMNIDNIFIDNIDEIPLIDVVKIEEDTRIDVLIFRYYNGLNNRDGIDDALRLLPLILLFNNIPDITNIKIGTLFKFPDLDDLLFNCTPTQDEIVPGVNTFKGNFDAKNNFTTKNSVNGSNSKSTTAMPKLSITLPKVSIDNKAGIITF